MNAAASTSAFRTSAATTRPTPAAHAAAGPGARNTLVAANVDFGRVIGYAAYGHSKGDGRMQWDETNPYGAVAQRDPSTNSHDVLIGVAVPLGATTLLASCIHKDDRTLADRDATQLAIGASYAFPGVPMSMPRLRASRTATVPATRSAMPATAAVATAPST
jgi:predicted porin